MKLGPGGKDNHVHSWSKGDERTSFDAGHSHAVSDPESGWTDRSVKDGHRHKIP